jgi:hypothetical protein
LFPSFPFFVRESIYWSFLTTVFPHFSFFLSREYICWFLITTVFPKFA